MVRWEHRRTQLLGANPRAVVVGALGVVAFFVATSLFGVGGHNADLFGGAVGGLAAGVVAGGHWDTGIDAGGRAASYGFAVSMLLLGVGSFVQFYTTTGELFFFWVPTLTTFAAVVLFPAFLFGGLAGGVVGSWLRGLVAPLEDAVAVEQ